ncbi:MAG TPA: hypothetical protein VFZ53_25745 [Polyangiaceae bacterium]
MEDVSPNRASMVRRIALGSALIASLLACQRSSPTARDHDRRTSPPSAAKPANDGGPLGLDATLAACREHARLPCDVREEACQRELFEVVQCLRGSRDAERPPLRFVSEAVSRRHREERRAEQHAAQASLERAAAALGLASDAGGPRADGVGPNAYYAPLERVVYFVASDAVSYESELAAFVVGHEYVHALQDRHGALAGVVGSREKRTFDEELAVWSLLEGEATLLEEILRGLVNGRDVRTWVPARFASRTAGSDEAITRQRRPLEASFATFPYTYGAHWAAAEWLAGNAPVADAASRRLSTRDILARRHGWPIADPPCSDKGPEALVTGERRHGREALGAWLVQAYVRRRARDAAAARAAAMKSRGDWLAFYSRGQNGDSSFIWRTCWDSETTALEMRSMIEAQLRETSSESVTVTTEGPHVIAGVHTRASGTTRPK